MKKVLHLPLPDGVYAGLHAEAERSQRSASTVAGEAISQSLRARKRAIRREEVMQYATQMAGTDFDVDPTLEFAALEELIRTEK